MKVSIFYLVTLLILVIGSSCSSGYSDKIAPALKDAFQSIETDSIYLGDSIMTDYKFDYGQLHHKVPGRDTALLQSIIDSGQRVAIAPEEMQNILLPKKIRILTFKQFYDINVPPPSLTSDERRIEEKIDSIYMYMGRLEVDSAQVKAAASELAQLEDDTLFKSASVKIRRSRKRLVYFPPLLKFKDHFLLVLIILNPPTETYEVARIVSLKSQ